MNWLDVIAVAGLLVAAALGIGRGFFAPVLGLAGAIAGLAIGFLLAGPLAEALTPVEQPLRGVIALLVLVALVVGGETIGGGLGGSIGRGVPALVRGPLDQLGGALVGLAQGIFFIWLIGGLLAAGVAPGLSRAAHGSLVLRLTYELLPPPGVVAGRLISLFEASELPRIFAGLEPEPAPPVELPDDERLRALAESAVGSTVRVDATGCGDLVHVGSGFFIGPTQAVTNAHVVAGSSETTVTLGETVYTAMLVLFDADADLALLTVSGIEAPGLELSAEAPSRGQTAVVIGYPGGGPLTAEPAGVTASYSVTGPDIYGEGRTSRPIVELQAGIERGDSGGPLVIEPGIVGGVVFGASRGDPNVGYALAAPYAAERLQPGIGSSEATDTGSCR